MFFVFSKMFWMLGAPSHWLVFLVVGTALGLLLRWYLAARFFAVTAVAILVVAWLTAVPLARAWEERYPRPAWPAHVDGILVLGSGFNSALLLRAASTMTGGGA